MEPQDEAAGATELVNMQINMHPAATPRDSTPDIKPPSEHDATSTSATDLTSSNISRDAAWSLYLSHFLSTWNSRSFEFASVLFLAAIYPGTLLYLSIYAICRSAAAILFATAIGKSIDRRPRLQIVRLSIVGGRLSIILSALGMWTLWTYQSLPWHASMGIFSVLVLLACAEKAASIMNLVSVVVMAGSNEPVLQKLNARMRRIDLLCKLIGPLVVGLVNGGSTTAAIWLVLAMNGLALPVEYFAIQRVYRRVPALGLPRPTQPEDPGGPIWQQILDQFIDISKASKLYFRHSACLPSFVLALLYLTVLSMSGQMITYLVAAGINSFYVSTIRAIATIVELSATWIAPRLMSRIGPTRAGMWFLNWQVVWLAATVSCFWAEQKAIIAASGLSAGTILSRVGLWGYDLSAQVIIQTEVQEDFRGSFSSVEAAFQNLFELLSYALTIALPHPSQFKYPVLVSGVAVFTGGVMYAGFVRRRRGHLLHIALKSEETEGIVRSGDA